MWFAVNLAFIILFIGIFGAICCNLCYRGDSLGLLIAIYRKTDIETFKMQFYILKDSFCLKMYVFMASPFAFTNNINRWAKQHFSN